MDNFSQFWGVEYKFGCCSLKLGVWPKIKCKFPQKMCKMRVKYVVSSIILIIKRENLKKKKQIFVKLTMEI